MAVLGPVAAPVLPFPAADSVFRDDRDLDIVEDAPAASAKVASAGVEGLLARPLFVVVTVVVGVGGGSNVGVSFLMGSRSSILTDASFLLFPRLFGTGVPFAVEDGSGGGGGISVSGLETASELALGIRGATTGSFGAVVSVPVFAPLICWSTVGVLIATPFGCLLFEAADVGRCREASPFGWVDVEFFRAREEAGRG